MGVLVEQLVAHEDDDGILRMWIGAMDMFR